MTYTWAELERIVGDLPPSALEHPAYWGGERSAWPGFRATNVRRGVSVTFVRRGSAAPARRASSSESALEGVPDLVLIGCVKSKLTRPAAAKDLYVSALFAKTRAYAEATGAPWFILSAMHGMVLPDQQIAPYDLYLADAPREYLTQWGERVVSQLQDAVGPVEGKVIEIHASAAYVDAIRGRLEDLGARVVVPVEGLTMGRRLQWYGGGSTPFTDPPAGKKEDLAGLLWRLRDRDSGRTPADFLATRGQGLERPGLYTWWADVEGAEELSQGLGLALAPGLIYAGLAGATRTKSGKASGNTLWGRVSGMHLGGRHEFSTFRLSLGSILAAATGETAIDENALTDWMYEHLRVVAVPVVDPGTLDGLETVVLAAFDPPLNLMKMPRSPVRVRLSELRSTYGNR